MADINFWQFLAGLGLFLFAMKQLEAALATLGSRSFRELLRRNTQSPLRAIVSGTVATTIVQSSSLVGLFTLALAGAGMLELRNAVGIILGSNLGTTITGWLVATLGFKLSLGKLALPLIAVGSLGWTLYNRQRAGWQFILAVGLLLFGLDYMKESAAALQSHFDVEAIKALHPLVMFLVGAVFTAVIQSSSGTMVIVLSALNAGVVELPQAAALIIGADLGTTSTLIIGGAPGSQLQRQISAAHFFFNVIVDLLALAMLPLLLWLTEHVYHLGAMPLLALVAIHSSFNLVGIILFAPFVNPFAAFLQRLFPRQDEFPLQAIPIRAVDVAVDALEAANRNLLRTVIDLNRHCFKLREAVPVEHFPEVYESLKLRELDILRLYQRLQSVSLAPSLSDRVTLVVGSSREALMAAKEIKDIRENLIRLRHHENPSIQQLYQSVQQYQKHLYQQLFMLLDTQLTETAMETLESIREANARQHEAVHTAILPMVNDHELESMCPLLLNINREILLSNKALQEACQSVLQPPQLGLPA